MKIRLPISQNLLARVVTLALRIYVKALRSRVVLAAPELHPLHGGQHFLYCVWHEVLMLPAFLFCGVGIRPMISRSRDGEFISHVVYAVGDTPIRGSSSRGAVGALREMIRAEPSHIAITPDGPRGPRQQFQPGAVYVASRTGLPLVPIGVAYAQAWRLRSWDRFAIPYPFSRAVCYFGEPLYVPADADAAALEDFQRQAQQAMRLAEATAERMLNNTRRPKRPGLVHAASRRPVFFRRRAAA